MNFKVIYISEGTERVLEGFESKIFPIKIEGTGFCDRVSNHSNLNLTPINSLISTYLILTPKQMLQRLPIALVQVKAGNRSENLPNAINQIIYSSYQENEITKRVYNNIMNSVKL